MTDAIKVAVRVRPLSKQERESGHSFAWNVQANCISPVDSRDSRYTLDHVFGPNWTTHRIYEATTQPLLHKVISGFNSTVFAYGQTSSGKTYTMRGTPEDTGLIPLAVNEIFALIESCQDREFLLRVSYMELYNEEVHDLLAPKQMKLPIHESRENGVYVCGLREDIVTCPEQVLQLLEEGEANRHVGSTKMNDTSSRSHTVFRMVVESRALEADMNDASAVLVSTLTLVDLAGSERVAKTGAEGIRMKEGTAINKSLLTLGNVINKLSEGAQAQGAHIPYRDSKLTRILQPSLGGNAKTSVICAITPALCHAEESHSTLRFACRAKRVVNNAVVNEVLSDAAVLKRQAHEIEELKNRLSASGMTAEVEEQISHLRAQHLRSEQEKDLYRIKLEEEKLEREKAQKQVEVARKMMFESGGSREDVPKKSNRRETWCPGGKAGWKAPASAVEAFQAASQDDSSHVSSSMGARKRSYNGDAGMAGGGPEAGSGGQQHQCHHSTGAIAEGEEDEDGEAGVETVGEGPTPQRRRRAGRSMGSTSSDASDLRDGGALVNELERIADGLDGQDRAALEAAISQLGGMQAQVAAMQRELDDVARLATTKDDELRYAESEMEAAVEERDRLAPQVEEAKWHARQMEKRIEEAQAAGNAAGKERDVVAGQLSALQESSAADLQEAAAKLAALEAERAGFKDQIKALGASLSDVKDALTCETEQKKLVEARAHASREELAEAEAQLSKRAAELDALRKAQESALERMEAAEVRRRDLYEANKRLEAHVHDLESRKRAPLYQKKQEEELRAANEKAMEADVRAAEAEMNAKEFKASADALQAQLAELQAAAEKAARLAAEAAAETATKHNFEVQRLCNERAKIQDAHMEELEQLNFLLESTKETLAGQQEVAAAQAKQVQELTAQLADVHKQMGEREAVQAEVQACAAAASEKIAHLEEEAEAMQAANEQAVQGLKKELHAAQEAATQMEASLRQQLQEEATSAAEHLRTTQEQAEEQVRSAQEQAQEAQSAAAATTAEATKRMDEMKSQVATMEARLQEAAGALKAKDDLREERMKHKQEVSALKSDIQKLQLESKSGGKSKELAAKEMEALKKKVGDLENKMRAAIQDKNSACQEKSKLESQVKQLVSQKQLLDRNQGKQENIELKKRESIMVNFNKSRDALNSTEEKLKAATVELQKTGMDLVAKRSECQSLEGQVTEQESKINQLQAENARLGADLVVTNEAKDSLQAEHSSVQERLAATSAELEALQATHEQASSALASLREEHAALVAAKEQLGAETEQLRAALQELTTSSNEMAGHMGTLQAEHAELSRQHSSAQEELAAARAAVSAAEDARIAAESRLPELQELQLQLSAAHEEVADLQYAANEQQAAAAQQEQAAANRQAAADKAVQELQTKLQQLEASLASTQDHGIELQQQLDQAVELYTVVQGHADTLRAEKARLEEQLAERTQAQDASHARAASLEGDMEGLKAELGEVRTQLSQVEARAASHAEGLAKAQADLEAACTGREAAQQEAAAAKAGAEAAAAAAEETAGLKSQLAQAMQEFTDLEFSWNEERAALEMQAQQLKAELAAATAAAAADAASASRAGAAQPGMATEHVSQEAAAADGKDGSDAATAEANKQQQQQQQLEEFATQVAALQAQVLGMEGVADKVAQLERELQAQQGEHEALSQERCLLLQRLEELNKAAVAAAGEQQQEQEQPGVPPTCGPAFGSPVAAAQPAADPVAEQGARTEGDAQGEALAAALVAREALEQHNQQLACHRDQLLGVIVDLSAQLAASRATAAGVGCSQDTSLAENCTNEDVTLVDNGNGKAGGGMVEGKGEGQRASEDQQQQQQVEQQQLPQGGLRGAGDVDGEKEGRVKVTAGLQKALAGAQAELASKEAQLQEACQAYNDLTSEVAEKDLQLQQLQAATPATTGEAAAYASPALQATKKSEAALAQQQQQQQQIAADLQRKLAEADDALAALHAHCAALEEELHSSRAASAAAAAVSTEAPGTVQLPAGKSGTAEGMDAAPAALAVPKGGEACEPGGEAQDVQMAEAGEGGQGLLDAQIQQQQQVEELRQRVCALQQDLASLQASKDALQQDAEQRVQHLQYQLEQQQHQLATTAHLNTGVDAEQPAALATASADAESAGVERTSAAEQAEAERASAAELAEAEKEAHRQKQQELEAHIEQLKVALESAVAARAAAESQLQQSLDDAAAARAALESAQQLQQEPCHDDVQRQLLEDKVAQLQIALDNAAAAKAAVEARLGGEAAEAKTVATGLGQELDAVRSKVEQLEADLLDSETLAEQLRSAIDAKTTATQQATAQLQETLASVAALSEQQGVLQAELATVQQQAGDAAAEVLRLKEAWQVEASRRKDAQSAGEALQASLDDMHAQMELLVARAQEAEAERAALAEHLHAVQQQPQGPTPAQQEMLARMAQRLEALEAGHRRAVERLHEERDEARAAVEALQVQVEAERQQAAVAVEEVDLCAKAKEAELNARMLSLESQIHWLGEQNTQLQAELVRASAGGDKENSGSAAADAERMAELGHKCAALEADLRRTKRAEMKLQALLFRMRSDIETAGGSCANFNNLRDVRSLEYDVDMLTQKLKRTERLAQQQQQAGRGTPLKGGSKSYGPLVDKAVNPLADKENMVQQQGFLGGHSHSNSRS